MGLLIGFLLKQMLRCLKIIPEMFAPQYGAFCGYAMALNKLRPINPEIFDVIDGKTDTATFARCLYPLS